MAVTDALPSASDRAAIERLAEEIRSGSEEAVTEILSRFDRYEGEVQSLCGEVLERYEEATLVYRLSERLGSVLGEGSIGRLVVEDATRVLGARAGEVWLVDEEALVLLAAAPHEPAGWEDFRDDVVFSVLQSARPQVIEQGVGGEASVAVPLCNPEEPPMGVLVLRGRVNGRPYRTGEVKLLMAIGTLTSAFIRNDRLAAKARQADVRKREDEIARQVHRGLLPRRDPVLPGLDVAGGHRAAENVGGDYYGYVQTPDGALGLAMADVSGHGVGAAIYMAAAKGALQAEARRTYSPAELLRRTNEVLLADFSDNDMFATALYIRFEPRRERFRYAVAGHNPPLLLRVDGTVERLDRGGTALGMLREPSFEEEERFFQPGDVLVVYTDGLVEARDHERLQYGTDRLATVALEHRHETAARLRERVLQDLQLHCGAVPPRDDVTLVIVRAVPDAASLREESR